VKNGAFFFFKTTSSQNAMLVLQ